MFSKKNFPRGWLEGATEHLGKTLRDVDGFPPLAQFNQGPTVLGERPPEIPLDKEELLPVLPVPLEGLNKLHPGNKKVLKITTRIPEITHLGITEDIEEHGELMRALRVGNSHDDPQHIPGIRLYHGVFTSGFGTEEIGMTSPVRCGEAKGLPCCLYKTGDSYLATHLSNDSGSCFPTF